MPFRPSTAPSSSTSARLHQAARHVGQEARFVLTSLRSGPPHVARGDLAHDLVELRDVVLPAILEEAVSAPEQPIEANEPYVPGQGQAAHTPADDEKTVKASNISQQNNENAPDRPSPLLRPFLNVIVDPRAAGPHTLASLLALQRLLVKGSLSALETSKPNFTTTTAQHVLRCQFEQTDPGADEAVEQAVANVLAELVTDLPPPLVLEAVTTVVVSRNTFVHSPALCLRLEDVLHGMVQKVFSISTRKSKEQETSQRLVLELIVNQLLHTPLLGSDDEAAEAHDATRILCLQLVRTALEAGWTTTSATAEEMEQDLVIEPLGAPVTVPEEQEVAVLENTPSTISSEATAAPTRSLMDIIQDDLFLSLLMTGQAIWAYHDENSNISPGYVSLDVLSEICATIGLLWNIPSLRQHLVAQFETIFTGFYTRALVLLRKRRPSTDSISFNANLNFDAEVEIILESLVDLITLHHVDEGGVGALQGLFAMYDCHLSRPDVAMGLIVELTRCCGGTVDSEGHTSPLSPNPSAADVTMAVAPAEEALNAQSEGTPPPNPELALEVEQAKTSPWRHVPAHLKELCAQAIMGAMKCLFQDDHASAQTLMERSQRRTSVLSRQIGGGDDSTAHQLRVLRSKKRLMHKAAKIFNTKASRGIQFLVDSGVIEEPVSPLDVATFLRNGIVVGLDKAAVGSYLGEAGKAPIAGKSPPSWERDWFHKEVLQKYCSLFSFEDQSLLDGLRMFLAAFRLPGEAQQIDRILQAFSDLCAEVCTEARRLNLFSEDPKRASDAAYLLSFSIIMLNTDLHNDNIRADRKMSSDAFFKNNTDYGRDITEKGKEFPREYLDGIYNSIKEEQIRTEGEGADGAMTVERWKDVMRSSVAENKDREDTFHPSSNDAEDLTELVLEHTWRPIVSSIGALWGASLRRERERLVASPQTPTNEELSAQSGMLGVQGARLGMDMSLVMMSGVRQLGRHDILQKIFACVCEYTGLVNECSETTIERTWALTNSVEAQSAIVVVFRMALEVGEELDEESWRFVWTILFELRDLKVIARGGRPGTVFYETDPDFLNEKARRHWNMCVMKGDMEYDPSATRTNKTSAVGSVLGVFGRALFGSDDAAKRNAADVKSTSRAESSTSGKEELLIWDEGAVSDDEADDSMFDESVDPSLSRTAGSYFESLLIQESVQMNQRLDMPVTGLERVEDTRRYQITPRARVRERLRSACNLQSLVSDSRFMNDTGIRALLTALVGMVASPTSCFPPVMTAPSEETASRHTPTREASDCSSDGSFGAMFSHSPLSPASEAFAEVLICEVALKNKDRLKELWNDVLQNHYLGKLTPLLVNPNPEGSTKIPVDPGLEKRISGLLRLSIYAMQRIDLSDEIIASWKYLLPMNPEQHQVSPLRALDRQIGEGLWRMMARADDLMNLKEDGWEGLLALFNWCAIRGAALKGKDAAPQSSLAEDDVALQCYRSLHLVLNTEELAPRVPYGVALSLQLLVSAGEKRRYSQLCVASLDLLRLLHEKKIALIDTMSDGGIEQFWTSCWRKIVEALAETSATASDASVRQHSLSMLTDLFLDNKGGGRVPAKELTVVLSTVCIPLAGRCIRRLQSGNGLSTKSEELLIEFELCIGLIFKPLRHHLERILGSGGNSLDTIWKAVLDVLIDLFNEHNEGEMVEDPSYPPIPSSLKKTMNSLAKEHFQNAIVVLNKAGVLFAEPQSPQDTVTSLTWGSVAKMEISDDVVQQWKKEVA